MKVTSCCQEIALTFSVLYKLFDLNLYHLENTSVILIISVCWGIYYYLNLIVPTSQLDCDISKDDPLYYKNNDQITPETALFPVACPFIFLYSTVVACCIYFWGQTHIPCSGHCYINDSLFQLGLAALIFSFLSSFFVQKALSASDVQCFRS